MGELFNVEESYSEITSKKTKDLELNAISLMRRESNLGKSLRREFLAFQNFSR